MNIYASAGFKDFLVACGYKGEMIREYFHNFLIHNSDLIINLRDGSCKVINSNSPDWQVGLIDTGLTTLTGGRLRRMRDWIGEEANLSFVAGGPRSGWSVRSEEHTLNSSHVASSYAVFCLKKKKIIHTRTTTTVT